jgi:antitoxin component YwqK of YwqJK toxin-antitoxin module
MIIGGQHQGTFRRWHENGLLAEEVTLEKGLADGVSRAFYPSGFLRAEATLRKGEVINKREWPDGKMQLSQLHRSPTLSP